MALDLTNATRGLLNAVHESLEHEVGRAFVQVGTEVAWDNCCDGQLSLRVISAQPQYPNGTRTAKCGPIYWRVVIGISVLRCASTVNDRGVAPSAKTITDEAVASFEEMARVQTAVEDYLGDRLITFSDWTPQGPSGGCAGGEWTLTMRVDA